MKTLRQEVRRIPWHVIPERLTCNGKERASLAYGIKMDFFGEPRFLMELRLADSNQTYFTQKVGYHVRAFFPEVKDLLLWQGCDTLGVPFNYKADAMHFWQNCPKNENGLVKCPTGGFLKVTAYGALHDDEDSLSMLMSYPTLANLDKWLNMRVPFLGGAFKSEMAFYNISI